MELKLVLIQEDECEFKGGVHEHGDFLEGFCFKLNFGDTDTSTEATKVWEICGNTRAEKIYWMNVLVRLVKMKKKVVKKPRIKTIKRKT